MPIKKIELKMDPLTEKIIVNYIANPTHKRELLERRFATEIRSDLQKGYSCVERLYDQIDVALLGMPYSSCKALELYFAKGYTYKALVAEFKYSFPYVRNLINVGLNEIFDCLDADELSTAKDFLQGKMPV